MNGLLKPHPGKVLLNGVDIHASKMPLKNVRQKVGLVFQYPEHQLFEETVFKDVAYGPRNLDLPEEEIHRRVMHALKLVGLTDEAFISASPLNLSGGEKRRVALAGVLAMEPEYLILDEPTAGLDPNGRNEIMKAIYKLHKNANIAVVLVTHSMEEVVKYSTEVNIMHEGKIVLSGKPKEVFAREDILALSGLKLPAAAEVVAKLRTHFSDLPTVLNVHEAASVISDAWRKKNAE